MPPIVNFIKTPKRWNVLLGECYLRGIPLNPFPGVAEHRWMPSQRRLVKIFRENLTALRVGFESIINNPDDLFENAEVGFEQRLDAYHKQLSTHRCNLF